MSLLQAILLGIIQGICEFLPVSSSGHLILMERLFGISEGGMFFVVMVHLGTLAAVLIVYWKTFVNLICHPRQKMTGLLLCSTVPTVVIALIIKKVPFFASFFQKVESGSCLGYCFLITAVFLLAAEFLQTPDIRRKPLSRMTWRDSVTVGCIQGLAVLPGVSRTGMVLSGSLLCGMSKKAAADYSFLLSIISITGGIVLEIPDTIRQGFSGISWWVILAGTLSAFVTGLFSIRLMLKIIRKGKLYWFAGYAALIGVALLINQLLTVPII